MRRTTVDIRGRTFFRDERGKIQKKTLTEHALSMTECARVVIEMNAEANIINHEVKPPFIHASDYLVVTGQRKKYGEIEQAILLEIGFRRSVPYRRFEFTEENKRFHYFIQRNHLPMTNKETLSVLSALSSTIQEVIDVGVSKWKNGLGSLEHKLPNKKGGHTLLRGLYVSVPKDQELLLYAFLLLDYTHRARFRKSKAHQIERELKGLRYANYSPKELKANSKVRAVADSLKNTYTERQLADIAKYLGSPSKSKNRALYAAILEVFNIKARRLEMHEEWFEMLHKKYRRYDQLIKKLFKLSVAAHWKRDKKRGTHALDCFRFEVHPSKKLRQKVEREALQLKPKNVGCESDDDYHGEF